MNMTRCPVLPAVFVLGTRQRVLDSVSAVLIFMGCFASFEAFAAPAGQTELADRVSKLVHQHYPAAQIAQDNGNFTAKHGTMTFAIHRRSKTGEILQQTTQVEGPNDKGFMFSMSVQDGSYEGQAVVPQTLRNVYWQTYVDRAPTEDGNGHYVISFSFGSRIDSDFMKALFKALPKSTNGQMASDQVWKGTSTAKWSGQQPQPDFTHDVILFIKSSKDSRFSGVLVYFPHSPGDDLDAVEVEGRIDANNGLELLIIDHVTAEPYLDGTTFKGTIEKGSLTCQAEYLRETPKGRYLLSLSLQRLVKEPRGTSEALCFP